VAGIALYTTKHATDGEVVLSDTVTLARFKKLTSNIVIPFVRTASETVGRTMLAQQDFAKPPGSSCPAHKWRSG
jgi:hypothetical protein